MSEMDRSREIERERERAKKKRGRWLEGRRVNRDTSFKINDSAVNRIIYNK